jgi:radical SAM/Cys-rich protein
MTRSSLHRQGSPLAQSRFQLQIINNPEKYVRFDDQLDSFGLSELQATAIKVLQVNLGKLCNQTCRHCHVDAGPDRREVMSRQTMQLCLDAIVAGRIATLDITGGAPEMNPDFRWLVAEARKLGCHVIDRCNLTILVTPGFIDLPEFLAEQCVEVVASLPCYKPENTDRQRGIGVFDKSITALRRLNALGYGKPGSDRILSLVYNPLGPSLPPPQTALEATYRKHLVEEYGIEFNRLYTITNMPISRFLDELLQKGNFDAYMQKLIDAFNPETAESVMCRTMLSVNWDGKLSDCDFNQMLELPLVSGQPRHIRDFDVVILSTRKIATGQHCFGCTAGNGSSCQGATVL